jgi:segregation and condensation protein A
LDIYDIPISQITESYVGFLNEMREMARANPHGAPFDINLAGEFLVMAATLMEIKSAMLLPQEEKPRSAEGTTAAELADPRAELVQKLLEYKRFKDASRGLEEQQASHAARYARVPVIPGTEADEPPPLDMDEVQIWDLLTAFSKLMAEVGTRKPKYHEVTYDDTPIDLHAADIEDRLKREGKLSLRQLLTGRKSRSEMIGVFLALLELTREKKILVVAAEADSAAAWDFEIIVAPEEHRKTYAGASLHLADLGALPEDNSEAATG